MLLKKKDASETEMSNECESLLICPFCCKFAMQEQKRKLQ